MGILQNETNELAKQDVSEEEFNYDDFDFDAMDDMLEQDFEELTADLEFLTEEKEKIGNPDALGKVVMDTIWEQFSSQFAVAAGEDFIKENHGNTLDLRNSAHIQTVENFEKGKIATHNYKSKDQLIYNYNRFQNKNHSEFRKEHVNPGMDRTLKRAGDLNKSGISTVKDIYTGKQISTQTKLANGKNNPTAAQREHVNASAKLYQNSSLQMSYNDEQLAGIINSPNNLQGYTTAERNNRKSDKSTAEMAKKDQTKHYEKAKKKSDEYIKQKEKEGEDRLKEEGRQTQKEEAFRIGKTAIRAVVMQLLAELVKEIIAELVKWFKSSHKKLKTLLDSIKQAIHNFIKDLKNKVFNAGKTLLTTILTAIFGPIDGMFRKFWSILAQGWRSLKGAINYIIAPENKSKSLGLLLMEAGKIVIAGMTGIGAMLLSEVIEKGLLGIPLFAVEIPFLGSLANILGSFFGAVVPGIIGAIAINRIEKWIDKRLQQENVAKTIEKQNEILNKQAVQIALVEKGMEVKKEKTYNEIEARHEEANELTKEILNNISSPIPENNYNFDEMQADLASLL